MKLVLHIGAAKAGSTSLQRHLYDQRQQLQQTGVRVVTSAGQGNARGLPAAFMDDEKVDDFIAQQGFSSREQRAAFNDNTLRRFTIEANEAQASGCHTLIVSSEHFQSRLHSKTEVRRCAETFAGLFDNIQIVLYLRRQDRAAVSRYSEWLRAGWAVPNPFFELDRLGREAEPPVFYNYRALVERWSACFGEGSITLRPYGRDVDDRWSIVTDFLSVCGLGDGISKASSHADTRAGFSMQAQACLVLFNTAMGEENRLQPEVKAVREGLLPHIDRDLPGRPQRPSQEQAKSFMGYFESQNAGLTAWYRMTPAEVSWQETNLFDNHFDDYPAVADEPDIGAAEVSLRKRLIESQGLESVYGLLTSLNRPRPNFLKV